MSLHARKNAKGHPAARERAELQRLKSDRVFFTFQNQIKDPDFEGFCHCMLYYKEK